MAATSRLGAAEDGLYTAVAARPGFAGVPFDRANPGSALQTPQHVWIGSSEVTAQTWDVTGAGAQLRQEAFTVQVYIRAVDTDVRAARDKALTLAGEVEAALRADWTLGGAVFSASVAAMRKDAWMDPDNGWGAGIRVDVGMVAMLA